MQSHGNLRAQLISAFNVRQEMDDLLGPGRGTVRRCWNKAGHSHEDKSPSLSFNPQTGAWRCHACQEKGDIFTLHMRLTKQSFPETFKALLAKYNIYVPDSERDHRGKGPVGDRRAPLEEAPVLAKLQAARETWTPQLLAFMRTRYGLLSDTIVFYHLGRSQVDGRVWIPVFARRVNEEGDNNALSGRGRIVNIRKHDCFRRYCFWQHRSSPRVERVRPQEITEEDLAQQEYGDWKPSYTNEPPHCKVLSVKGYGGIYLYPFEQLLYSKPETTVYVVGGELKALLLIQQGVCAVSFTGGEGSVEENFLPYFLGRKVRVLMDPDEAGCAAATKLSRVLANAGAYVEKGIWPGDLTARLPEKGDVTDLLRLHSWNAAVLDSHLMWVEIDAQLVDDDLALPQQETFGLKEGVWEDMTVVPFQTLVDPQHLGEWVRTPALISGRGDAPYAVPRKANITCEAGKKSGSPFCISCSLPGNGFVHRFEFPTEGQLALLGSTTETVRAKLIEKAGIPRKCRLPDVQVENSAVETCVLTPTLDVYEDYGSGGDLSPKHDRSFEFRHQPAVLLSEARIKIVENSAYEFGGVIIPEPKTGRFTYAIREYRPLDNHVLHYKPNAQLEGELRERMFARGRQGPEVLAWLISQVRDHLLHLYEQDEMVLTLLMTYFLPFSFKLGQFTCERVCPSVLLLGDSNTGKSTTVAKLMRHYRAGRYADLGSKATFAGLIGGNMSIGGAATGKMQFTWGLLPTSHRGLVVLDEYNKLSEDDIGALTNTISSGVAERVTVNGNRRTMCWVRLLYLANPRNARPLATFANPLDAAFQIAGTPQDLGRIDFVHVQPTIRNIQSLNQQHVPTEELGYTSDLARYHLQWAWSLQPDQIKIVRPDHVFTRAIHLVNRYNSHPLLYPAQAKFKIARLAAGVAALLLSLDDKGRLIVQPEHVEFVAQLFEQCYDRYFSGQYIGAVQGMPTVPEVPPEPKPEKEKEKSSKEKAPPKEKGQQPLKPSPPPPETRLPGMLPVALTSILDRVPDARSLQFLVLAPRWSRDDILDAFQRNQTLAFQFLSVAQLQLGLITNDRGFFKPQTHDWPMLIGGYLAEREKQLNERSME